MTERQVSSSSAELSALVEQVCAERGRRIVTAESGARAVLVSLDEFEDLEDLAAAAAYLMRREAGTQVSVPHDEAVRSLRRRTA